MAAGTKTFTTQFLIGSKFVGQKGFAQANKALTTTQKTAMAVNRGIGSVAGGFTKLAGAIGVAAVAYKVLREAQELWQEGWKASEDAIKVQEALGVAAQRNAKRYKMSGAAIEKSVSGVSAKVAAVGFDSEDATAGTTKLLESMSPKQIEGFSQAYADLTAKLKGATPGAEGFEEVSTDLNKAILTGKAPWLTQIGATDKQIKALKKLTPAARAAYLQQIIQNRLQGEAARVFDTTTGKIAKAAKAREDVGQALTAASVAQQGKLSESYERVYKSLEPIAKEIGDKFAEASQKFADWLIKHEKDIAAAAKAISDWAFWMWDQTLVSLDDTTRQLKDIWGLWVKSIEDTKAQFEAIVEWIDKSFIQPIYKLFSWLTEKVQAMWQLILPKLDALNLVNQQANLPPGTGGEAERRAIEGRANQQRGSGYAPYTQRGTGGAAGPPSASLQEARARYAEELAANPALQEKLARLTAAEVGGQGEEAQQALIETAMNRAASRNQTLAQTLQPNYYEPLRRGGGLPSLSAAEQSRYAGLTKSALAGSNVSNYATGNWSGPAGQGLGGRGGYATKKIGGEQFSVQAADTKWAAQVKTAENATKAALQVKPEPTANISTPGPQGDRQTAGTGERTQSLMEGAMMRSPGGAGGSLKHMIKEMNLQQRTSGATGGQNIAMNAPITVNGVAPGREALMAKKTALALRDPTAQLLTEIKRARTQEQRLGYV